VRYIGVSDTPAWKTTQAQLIAQFRGWTPFVGLQIEYSLLERTVEGELIPMAQEMGLGVTPWSPLKSGTLSGKYTRENAATVKADRGERVTTSLNERVFAIIDELRAIGTELQATPAAVALAWVQGRPGVCRHPRPPCIKKSTGQEPQVRPGHPGLPCAMALRLPSRSPRGPA